MTIIDLFEQREGVWHNISITYITIGDPVPTKPDQNQFDQEKQLIYFMDDDNKEYEMTVYVPNTPQGLEYIDPKLKGTKAVFKIKHKDKKHLTGVLTDKKPSIAKKNGPDWEKIALGKCRHGILCAYVRFKGIDISDGALNDINELAKFSMTGEIK